LDSYHFSALLIAYETVKPHGMILKVCNVPEGVSTCEKVESNPEELSCLKGQ